MVMTRRSFRQAFAFGDVVNRDGCVASTNPKSNGPQQARAMSRYLSRACPRTTGLALPAGRVGGGIGSPALRSRHQRAGPANRRPPGSEDDRGHVGSMSNHEETTTPTPWKPTSPKLTAARANWYRYYAGYSTQFVRDVLAHLGLPDGATILDPWNGSGTTTAVASESGYRVIGYDRNPALVVVARGRQLDPGVAKSLEPLTADLLKHAREEAVDTADDPLGDWFDADTTSRLRAMERAIQRTQVDEGTAGSIAELDVDQLSTLAAYFYVAHFELTRSLVSSFRTSNPTWIKSGSPDELVAKSWDELEAGYRAAVGHLKPNRTSSGTDRNDIIAVGNSTSLPATATDIGATLTSPPYCTRIDYVMATRPELAVLGYGRKQLRDLRDAMVGTPTMWTKNPDPAAAYGATATETLSRIAAHRSKASAGYYTKYFSQYFDALARSVGEIRRVSKPGAPAVLVVQDSYYKEIHVDLAAIVTEMLADRGWLNVEAVHFPMAVTKAAIHPGARTYRSTFSATETVLVAR